METIIQKLKQALPNWHFRRYSEDPESALILCIPNGGYINLNHYAELRHYAPIVGNVGAAGYTINRHEVKI